MNATLHRSTVYQPNSQGVTDRLLQGDLPPDPVARAAAVVPVIAANLDRIDKDRRLPPAVLEALHAAGLFRLLLPRSAGGEEVEPAEFVQVIMTLAAADASVAWCVCQGSVCSMAAAYMAPDPVAAIWGDDPTGVLAWGAGSHPVAKAVQGGYRVTGTWGYASGNRHATWLGGHCRIEEQDGTLRQGPGGAPLERTLLFPRAQATVDTDWNTLGLRGTGSDGYSVTDLFVPEDYTVIRDVAALRQQAGPLFRCSTTNLYAAGFGALALGIARGAIDALVAVATVKTPQATTRALRDSPVVQMNVALAEAKLQAASLLLFDSLREAYASVADGAEMTLDHKMRIRMAGTFATHQARDVVSTAFHEAGATAIFDANPFERRLRDVNSVGQQVQARAAHFETVGGYMLGASPNLRFI